MHQPCAPCGSLERVASSAAVESMTLVISVAMSLMHMIRGSAARSQAGIGGSSQSSTAGGRSAWEFPRYSSSSSNLVRTYVGCGLSLTRNRKRPADINAADQSAARLLCQDKVQTCLSLAADGTLEGVGHATFGGAKKSVQKRASFLSPAKSSSSLPFSLSTSQT